MKLSHPFIAELKRYVANQNATLGPIVMQICEVIQIKDKNSTGDEIVIKAKQRQLSEVTDMIHAAHVFHRCVRDTSAPSGEVNITKIKRLHQDNVMSLLIGDYLLAQSSVDMADLRFPKTVGFIAKGLEDYTRGEFLKLQLVDDHAKKKLNHQDICSQIGRYAQLTCGSLLSNACLSAALLAGYPVDSTIPETKSIQNTNNNQLSFLVHSFGFHTGSAHRLIEMLYCPDTNSEDDRDFIKTLDVKHLDESIRSHLLKSVDLLHKLPNSEKQSTLLSMLDKMRIRCSSP